MTFQNEGLVKRITSCFLLLLLLLSVAACNEGSNEPDSQPLTAVRYQMGWVHEYSSAGFYAAEKNGHFTEQGVAVTLVEGGFGENGYIDPVEQLVMGKAEFTSLPATRLLEARAEGAPIVAIAAQIQRSPSVLMSRAEKNIVRPSDLRGKRVTVSDGGARALFEALLAAQNIDLSEVDIISRSDFGIDSIIEDEVDVLSGWIINEGVLMQEAGLEPNFILPGDYGIEAYSALVVVTESMVIEQPEVIEGFLRALFQGHQDIIDNPEQAIDYTLMYDGSLEREGQMRRLQKMLPLIKPAGRMIGDMDSEVWSRSYQIFLEAGLLSEAVDLETAYTPAFIEQIYSE